MTRLLILFSLATLLFPAFVADPIYLDIYQQETDREFVLGNQRLELRLDKQTGNWTTWTTPRSKDNLLNPSANQPALDVSINGEYIVAKHGATLLRRTFAVDADRRGATLSVTLGILPEVGSQPARYAYELTATYRLLPMEGRIERSATLLRNKPGNREHFDGFRFRVPGVRIGAADQCRLTVPGPFWPKTLVRADTPYDSLKMRTINFHQAPDAGFGLLVLENKTRNMALASFMSTGGEVAYGTAIDGDGRTITFRHDDKRAYYLDPGQTVASDVQILTLAPDAAGAIATYRQMVEATMPLDTTTPAWVREQVILEVYPKYFKGGLADITARLPFYKGVGVTMIYLMPHWTGGYSPMDPYELDPRFGTKADLRSLIKTAHGLGMKVIFDMVIHGFNQQSPVPGKRPDLFVRNETGKLANHPTWKSITTDWASPAYQQYMVDLVLHDQREYDNDGYRVDAATYKGAGWNPNVAYPAYRDGSAAPELMRAMLTALRKNKPDAVLLSEVFGPVFYTVCNFVHDNQTEAVPTLLRRMQASTYTAEDYKRHLATVFGALPRGANRVFYARNHDTSWFDKFDGYTPRFMAFETVHALFGIPELFAGDPDYPFNPDDNNAATYAQYKRLFAFRKQWPEFTRGSVLLDEVVSSNPQVFAGGRKLGESTPGNRASVALVSFSDKPEPVTVTLSGLSAKTNMLTDIQTGQPVVIKPANGTTFSLTLKPFQAVAGRL